jgi:luciferase family oxidoreductase group 1
LRLSVLNLATVGTGFTPADALQAATLLAQEAERLGYHRYWVAEHHNMPGIASSAPPVLIAHLASATARLRIGSGGVMLPNHSPLVVAEQFGTLEALHPGRIDLGLGRAPGTDGRTALALRRTNRPDTGNEFPQQLGELLGYFNGTLPDDHPFARITATPGIGYQPSLWLLGSSDFSAVLAGQLGLPFSFAHHFAGNNTDAALAAYREQFRPTGALEAPYVMLGVNVVCAPTDEEAEFLAGSGRLAIARLRQGMPGLYPTPEQAAAHDFTESERHIIDGFGSGHIVGGPETVRKGLEALVERTGADELMITTAMHDPAMQLRSFQLVAGAADMAFD